MEIHPIADLVPSMSSDAYADLLGSIRVNGLIEPITLCENKILDGRHRARACEEAGIKVRYVEYSGDSPATYVLAKNLWCSRSCDEG